ncbi:unnamed protein product [Mytilus coruscus]|uniref:Novel STAND NTPase 3 domain-containing protein n=1 Tax=Mytilus coruscus TaxID=42192 RepID=A0A6J8DXN7_MYTCO|nr:unnamed protein product [Mytilus coruscus]
MRDFNFDLNTGNTSFLKFMGNKFCCSQIVSKATTSYGTLLDLIFLNFDRVSFLSGTTLGLEHVKEIHEETCVLAKHAQVLSLHCKEIDMQIVDVNNTLDEWYNILQVLIDMKTKFEDKISSLEKHVFEMNSQIEQQNKKMKEIEKNMEHCMCFSREVQAFSLAMQAQLLEIGDRKVSLLTEQKECIPENIRAQHDQYLKEWIKDDALFVNTRAAKYSLSSLQSNNCLLVTGSSGTGKSFIVHHIALHLFQKDGYEIIPFVTGPSDIIHYYDPKRKQVFVVDDICGKESINIQIIELWKSYYSNLEKIFLPSRKTSRSKDVFQDTKLLISCRLLIAKDKQFRNIELFTRNECNLLSSNMCLLPQERLQMIQKYLPEEMIHYVESILENFDCFPLLCCLSKNKTSEELVKLFSSPIEIIKSDVNNIHLQNKFQFCALVLCVLFREGFSEKWVQSKSMPEENKFKIYEIIKQLSIDLTIESSRKSLVEGFTILEGTYLKKRGTSYRIIHDKVYTFISVICGEHLTSCFLRYAPSSFIRDNFLFTCCHTKHTDIFILLDEDMEEEYFNRLYDDLKNRNLDSTFHNKLLKYTSFRNKLLEYLRQNEEAMGLLKDMNRNGFEVAKASLIKYRYFRNFTNPMIEAAAEGFPDILKFLIDIEFNEDYIDTSIYTLYAACRAGNVNIVKFLLSDNTDIRFACTSVIALDPTVGLPLLLVSCIEGHTTVVRLLLDGIADLIQCIQRGEESRVHNANEVGYTDLDNLFYMSQGIDLPEFCIHGKSPIYMACYKGHFDIVKVLLDNDAHTSILCDRLLFAKACKDGFAKILKLLIKNYKPTINLDGNTLLVEACMRGHTEIVEVLLANYTDEFQYEFKCRLPLLIACQKGHSDIVRLLLRYSGYGARCHSDGRAARALLIASEIEYEDIEKMVSEYNSHAKLYGYSNLCIAGYIEEENKLSFKIKIGFYSKYAKLLLQMACYLGHLGTVRVLLENSFNVNECNSYGVSSLYAACVKGHTNIVYLLLGANADVFRCDKFGKSPLFVACENGHANTVKLLLEHNAEISPCGKSKKSPFFVACEKGHADIVRILIKTKRNIYQSDRFGRSPLYVACREGHAEIVNILLSNNAIQSYHNKYGKSAMCVACENGHLHTINLLLKKNIDFSHCVSGEFSLIITALGRGHVDIANMLVQNKEGQCQCDWFIRTQCLAVCEKQNINILKLLEELSRRNSTLCADDTDVVEIVLYTHPDGPHNLLRVCIPRQRLYTDIVNLFIKIKKQNET